ncbi:hypothetical protein GSI_01130 [Ganoderma sinense ZZ0214-1]|uniref:RING-type domain-containing protein n=1 Tax=Ganoderma sinense ZZ0214-1 TaxID=1077348 RepID=A0A2G8SUI5_9APHY|nr:hypothetical protein GSI_01130 [Ganoderma sinense ZZ0214-1]
MGPTTRSASRPKASSSKSTLDHDQSAHATNEPPPAESDLEDSKHTTLEGLLKGAFKEAKRIERENASLRKKVAALEDKLSKLEDSDNAPLRPKRTLRTSTSVAGLQGEVHKLKSQVQQLQKSKQKYRKKVHDLSLRELKSEANELVEDAEFEVGDSAYQMRKLLWSFHDLMVANSLEEGEECPICMESLKPKECRSMPCQHMFCNDCLSQLRPIPGGDRDTESISCPQCRELCQRDELELVEYTASEQWDALLEVAKQWARMDTRREADTSEEEDEEEFLDDGENEISTTASEHMLAPFNPLETSPEPEQADGSVPQAEPQISPSRLRRRTVVETPRTSSEPEPEAEAQGSNGVPQQEAEGQDPEPEQSGTPPPQAGPSSQPYSQTPRKAKRKMLEELAAARSKKRRI